MIREERSSSYGGHVRLARVPPLPLVADQELVDVVAEGLSEDVRLRREPDGLVEVLGQDRIPAVRRSSSAIS